MNEDYSDQPVTVETKLANARHDSERHSICMDDRCRIKSRNVQTAVLGPLTDKKIVKYEAQGYYSQAFREARREFWANRSAKRAAKRDGNFLIHPDGRKVFSPI